MNDWDIDLTTDAETETDAASTDAGTEPADAATETAPVPHAQEPTPEAPSLIDTLLASNSLIVAEWQDDALVRDIDLSSLDAGDLEDVLDLLRDLREQATRRIDETLGRVTEIEAEFARLRRERSNVQHLRRHIGTARHTLDTAIHRVLIEQQSRIESETA